MTHPPERDWMIVAPWWQWQDPATVKAGEKLTPDLAAGRLSVPIFQKYDSPKLVNDFIEDPQRCLKFVEEDLVHAVYDMPPSSSNSKLGKLLRMSAFKQKDKDGNPFIIDQQYLPDGTDTRKIFLDSHKRFYLVVCQIHCDGPGFPKAARDKICEAGFVVRRRRIEATDCAMQEAKPIITQLASGRAQLARVNQLLGIEAKALESITGQPSGLASNAKLESLLKTRKSLQDLVEAEKARFEDWANRFDLKIPRLEGWLESEQKFDKLGCWEAVEEMPEELGLESSFPLYPLIPDKNKPDHAGQFGTVYFGILPTFSRDCQANGRPRFDDQEFYEVRCWVRRHKTPHDRDQACPCPDRVFWSRPSRVYKLASHFDLVGTSHQPVTVQLPNLNELAAQAKPTLGVGFAKPPGSLMFSSDGSTTPQNKGRSVGFELCFLPIPLITIVATFVLELFLPIVVFAFQLWWMLALKFCIPPQINVALGINAELGLDGRVGLDLSASLEAGLELKLNAADPEVPGKTQIQAQFGDAAAAELSADYSAIAIANLEIDTTRAGDPASPDSPSASANLEFAAGVTHA